MSSSHSMLGTLILAFPIVGMLFARFFQIDEWIARPRRQTAIGHPLSHWDADGQVVCIDPDGRCSSVASGTADGERELRLNRRHVRQSGHLPQRGNTPAVRRVWVVWEVSSGD